jgi:putative addiction module component (TIGR02574 family)
MTSPAEELLARALRLSADDRERLAAELVASLEREPDAAADEAWLELAERRAREELAGVPGVPWDEIRARVASRRQPR